jgi:hypothetical protein
MRIQESLITPTILDLEKINITTKELADRHETFVTLTLEICWPPAAVREKIEKVEKK